MRAQKQTRRKAEREAAKREHAEERERRQRAAHDAGAATDAPEVGASPLAPPKTGEARTA